MQRPWGTKTWAFASSVIRLGAGRYSTQSRALIQAVALQVNQAAERVVILAGAGLSTPSGIPDFRTPGTGLYDNLAAYCLPYPEAIFDIDYFRRKPEPFNTWARHFFPGTHYRPSIGHFFIKMLDDKKKLLRLFTQNIDGLEAEAGLASDKIVAAHGSFNSASCTNCRTQADIHTVKAAIMAGQCPQCGQCGGWVKPDIVFFGEPLPDLFWTAQEDLPQADYLICIGTSLEVYPFAGLADQVKPDVPRLLINHSIVGSFGSRQRDTVLTGSLVEVLQNLIAELGWTGDLNKLMNG